MSKNILESFVLLALAVAFGMILAWPKYQEFQAQSSLVLGKRTDLETRQEYFKNLAESSSELNNYGPNLAKIESALPDDPKVSTLLDFLESSSMQAGLILKVVDYSFSADNQSTVSGQTPTGQPIQKNLKQFYVTFTLSGPYQSWKNFLSNIEKTSRMVEIESVQISGGDQTKIASVAIPSSELGGNLDYVVKLKANSY